MSKEAKLILTNLVTFIRAIGVGALIPVYKIFGGAITFLVSATCFLTDAIDGAMARNFKTSTFFGSLFDGTVDKLFLIANMIILVGITPLAWIPIILELGIAGVQTLKFKNDLKVSSNMFGKVKMWVAGITVSLSYLLTDYNFLEFFSADLATKVANMNQYKLFSTFLTPLVISEVITLGSYIKEFKKEKEDYIDNKNIKEQEKQQLKERIGQDIAEKSFKEILFSPEFYAKYQDSSNLMDIAEEILVRKRKK